LTTIQHGTKKARKKAARYHASLLSARRQQFPGKGAKGATAMREEGGRERNKGEKS